MKNYLTSAALAAFVLLSNSAFSQEPAAPAAPAVPATPDASSTPPKPMIPLAPAGPAVNVQSPDQVLKELQNSALLQAYMAVVSDLHPLFDQNINLKSRIGNIDGFAFSADTKKKLFDLFGNDNPLHLKSNKLADGTTDLSVNMDSLDYRDPKTGSKAHSSALNGKVTFNKTYTKSHSVITMPSFSFDNGKTTQLTASGLSRTSDQTRGLFGIWLGTSVDELEHVAIDDSASGLHVKFDGMAMKSKITQHNKLMDVDGDYLIKSVSWGDNGVSQVHMALQLTNIDEKEFAAISKKANNLNKTNPTFEESAATATGMLKSFGLAMRHGGAIEIQDISAQYHGMTARLNGRITFNDIQPSDVESPKAFVEKLVARFNLHVPMALVTDVSRAITRTALQQKNKDGKPVTDQAVDAMAKEMVDKTLDKLLNRDKWIRIEHDTILSTIEFKMGKLSINGQPVSLPGSK